MPPKFSHLRITPWTPKFVWVPTVQQAADYINRPHEDYPKYVESTEHCITNQTFWVHGTETTPSFSSPISISALLATHLYIFGDAWFAGKFRTVDVVVGKHLPPTAALVDSLTKQLESAWTITSLTDVLDWYIDFETIHPFRDGNGRVGGTTVAIFSHIFSPHMGYYAPLQ